MATETRPPLTRKRILQAALELVDEGGVDALTMRRLGDSLGFEAMSLYRHVTNKDDVLGGILDLVLEEWERPAPSDDWDAAIRRSAVSVHAALRRHGWAAALLMSGKGARPARLRYMDDLLGCLLDAGFPAETTYVAYHVLDGHIFGFALWETSHSLTAASDPELLGQLMRAIPWDDYPHLVAHRDQHLSEGTHHEVSAFELGLDLILDGLRELRPAT